jgi:hypothetical protein
LPSFIRKISAGGAAPPLKAAAAASLSRLSATGICANRSKKKPPIWELPILVSFLGNRNDTDVVYAGLDIVALTSHNEGTPLSLIEAMANSRARYLDRSRRRRGSARE